MLNSRINIETPFGEVPAEIHLENRRNIRASFTRKAAVLRMPRLTGKKALNKHIQWFENWVEENIVMHPGLQKRYFREYKNGHKLKVCGTDYTLSVDYGKFEKHSARLTSGNTVFLKITNGDVAPNKTVKKLLSKLFIKKYKNEVTERVHELNQRTFNKHINRVSLKYTISRWGSCSTNKNINLSSRLLLVPAEVRDYVIVHELAHLIEQNHSYRFWNLVEQAMPNYRDHQLWLKKYGEEYDF